MWRHDADVVVIVLAFNSILIGLTLDAMCAFVMRTETATIMNY